MGKAKKETNDFLPSAEVLKNLADRYDSETSDAAQANQGIGTLKKNAEKQHNVDWWAFKQAMRLKKKGETDRDGNIRHLIHYLKALGLVSQDDMFLGNPLTGNVEPSPSEQAELDAAETAAVN
jgi:hypothetical protein